MASLVLSGDTSGSITVSAPAVAGSNTQTLPAASGTIVVGSAAVSAVGQIPFSTDGTTYTPTDKIVSDTAVASTSGTSIDFTGIPSWAKRVTVMFSGVSTNGSSDVQIQLGDSGGIETTGYLGSYSGIAVSTVTTSLLPGSGFQFNDNGAAASTRQGFATITLLGSNIWCFSGAMSKSDASRSMVTSGTKSLSGTLTQVRITTVNGTDTFDAGTINILYE
jgi:hypothetical protein